MKILCDKCKIEISDELEELIDESLINQDDGQEFVPNGFYWISNGEYFTNSENNIIINRNNLINTKNHSLPSRLNGCCGLDGTDGINKLCINDHEIATVKQDCWMPHCVIIDSNLIAIHSKNNLQIELDNYCPCCDYDTFDKESRLNYSICPICFWEDDPLQFEDPNYEGGANRTSLHKAKLNYKIFGACEIEMVKNTRNSNKRDINKRL